MTSRLEPNEIGAGEWQKGFEETFRARGSAHVARVRAKEMGGWAAIHAKLAATASYSSGYERNEKDAVTFARLAHRQWLALRLMEAGPVNRWKEVAA